MFLICEKIRNNDIGHTLHLDNKNINDLEILELVCALKNNHTVRKIFLVNNLIGNSGAQALLELLDVKCLIQKIDLRHNLIQDVQIITRIKQKIKENQRALEKVNVFSMSPHVLTAHSKQETLETDVHRTIGYYFNDETLLHRVRVVSHNQDLEALGDALLDIVADLWSLDKTIMCRNDFLSRSETAKCLRNHLLVAESTGKTRHGDATEALLGAVFIDSAMDHRMIERVAFRIWGLQKPQRDPPVLDKDRERALGISLRKLACVQMVLDSRHYFDSVQKDQFIHALSENDSSLPLILTRVFLRTAMDYQAVKNHVKKCYGDIQNDHHRRPLTQNLQKTALQPRVSSTPSSLSVSEGLAVVGAALGTGLLIYYTIFGDTAKKKAENDRKRTTASRDRSQCLLM